MKGNDNERHEWGHIYPVSFGPGSFLFFLCNVLCDPFQTLASACRPNLPLDFFSFSLELEALAFWKMSRYFYTWNKTVSSSLVRRPKTGPYSLPLWKLENAKLLEREKNSETNKYKWKSVCVSVNGFINGFAFKFEFWRCEKKCLRLKSIWSLACSMKMLGRHNCKGREAKGGRHRRCN